jgi:hypothetical protein
MRGGFVALSEHGGTAERAASDSARPAVAPYPTTVLVTTSDALRAPTKLQLLVKVPETVEATPDGLIWDRREEPVAKEN